jgi:hypothetical protein
VGDGGDGAGAERGGERGACAGAAGCTGDGHGPGHRGGQPGGGVRRADDRIACAEDERPAGGCAGVTVSRARELPDQSSSLLADAAEIFCVAQARGKTVSRRALAAELRGRGHAFSNEQLRETADKASRPVAA